MCLFTGRCSNNFSACGEMFRACRLKNLLHKCPDTRLISSVIEQELGSRPYRTTLPIKPYQQNLTRAKPYLLTPPKPGVIGDLMTEIPLHKHCLICGNAVRPDENFCDELCESKFKSAQRKQQLLFVAFIVIMGLVLFLPSILKMKG